MFRPTKSLQDYCKDFKKHHPDAVLTNEQLSIVEKLAKEAKNNTFSCLDAKEFSLLDSAMRQYFSPFGAALDERRRSTIDDVFKMLGPNS